MKRLLVTSLGLLALAAFVAWAALEANAATRNVTVADNSYTDAVSGNSTTTINAGDTVQWNWSGSNPHTVDSTSAEAFSSGGQQTTGSFSHTFNAVGSFSYVCGVHGTAMAGTIVVQAGQAPTNTPQPTNTTAASQPTNTPAASASATPSSAAPTNTPGAGATAAPATAGPSTPAPSGTQSGGGALPTAGTGDADGDGAPWAVIAAFAAIAGLVLAGAAAFRVFRRPEM